MIETDLLAGQDVGEAGVRWIRRSPSARPVPDIWGDEVHQQFFRSGPRKTEPRLDITWETSLISSSSINLPDLLGMIFAQRGGMMMAARSAPGEGADVFFDCGFFRGLDMV